MPWKVPIHGARAIGLDGDLGSMETGKLADLIIMDKNPLEFAQLKHNLSSNEKRPLV